MRKRLFLLLCVCLLAVCFSVPSLAAGVGDINADGAVTAADARLALRFAVDLETPVGRQRLAADADHDGVLSAADARLILRVVVELEVFTHPSDREDHTVTVIKAPTCAEEGILQTVCVCGEVREETLPKTDAHSYPADWTEKTAAGCETEGRREKVCAVCGNTRAESVPPLGHAFEEKETKAGCETEGLLQSVCARCGKVAASKTLPPAGHTLTQETTKAPKCTEAGEQTVRCEKCGYTAVKTLPALGHDFSAEFTEERAATCAQAGIRSRRCSRCPAVTDSEPIPALGHDYREKEVTPAACTAAETVLFSCARCGAEKEETRAPALGHDYIETQSTPATCTAAETVLFSCARCGAEKEETRAPALGHSFTLTAVPATCTQQGSETEVCARCGAVGRTNETPALGHDFVFAPDEIADCTQGGTRTGVCSVCQAQITETIPAAAHSFAPEAVETVPATCVEAGSSVFRCSVCGMTQTETIPATGHQKVRAQAADAAPTCTAEGKEGYVCAVCGADLSTVIAAAGHQPQTVAGTPPTCMADGISDGSVCAVCGEVLIESVPLEATGHSYSAWETDEATGLLTRRCAVCGDVQTREPVCTHEYTETSLLAAGCETAGELTETCTLCGEIRHTLLPPTGHDYRAETVPPTCTAAGFTRYTCANCQKSFTDDETPALGHDGGALRGETPTYCAQTGYSGDLVCTRCGETLLQGQPLPLLPHTPAGAFTEETAPTCSVSGEEALLCTVCGAVLERRSVPALGHDAVYRYEENGSVRKTVCARCGAVLETASLTAALYTADGERTDIFDLEKALPAAPAGSTVVLLGDHTLRGSVAVPAGVCFVVPCFAGDVGYTADGGIPDGAAAENGDTKSRYCALTVPADCTLTVEGTLLINAQTGRAVAGPGASQDFSGGYGEILLYGDITVKEGGCFDCAGFVNLSAPAAAGTVTLLPGAVMYETAEILRFRGVTNALYSAYLGVYPIYEQSMRAVRAALTVNSGASLFGRTKRYAAANDEAALHPGVFPLIGATGLICLADGASAERRTQTAQDGQIRCVYTFSGGADFQGVSFTPLPGAALQTGDYLYPLNGDLSFVFRDGAYRLGCDLLRLPGAQMTVEENAVFSVPAGSRLVLAGDGFYEKDALIGDCAYPAGRAPAVLHIAEKGSVTAAGTLAGQVNAAGTLSADGAVREAEILVPTELRPAAAHKNEYTVTIS